MNWEMEYDIPDSYRMALMNLKTVLMLAGYKDNGTIDQYFIDQVCLYGATNPELIDLMTAAATRSPKTMQELQDIMAELQSHHPAVMNGAL